MTRYSPSPLCKSGDLAQLIGPRFKIYILRLSHGEKLNTHAGVLFHDDLIGQPWGSQILSHTGSQFLLVQPGLEEILLNLERKTQIVYPKDIGVLLLKMGVGPGSQVLEAGTGSGGMTIALANAVGPNGRVYSYEINENYLELARSNLKMIGLDHLVTLIQGNIGDGLDQSHIDAVFLDLPGPESYLDNLTTALKPGGVLGCILPTTNQVSRLVKGLKAQSFGAIEVCETLLRYYKADPQRLRPFDRMVSHTGYLVFARHILPAGYKPSHR